MTQIFSPFLWQFQILFVSLRRSPTSCRGPPGRKLREESLYIGKGVTCDALYLTYRNLAVPNNQSRIKATMTSIRYVVFVLCRYVGLFGLHREVAFIYISAWASALLVQTDWAMPEPLYVGRAAGWTPTLLFMYQPNHLKCL